MGTSGQEPAWLLGELGALGCQAGVPMLCSGTLSSPVNLPMSWRAQGPLWVSELCQPWASLIVITSWCVSLGAGEVPARFGATTGHPHLQQDGQEGQLCPFLHLQGPISARYWC